MKPTHTIAAILVASTALLTGCASTTSTPYNNGYNNAGYNNGYNNNVASGYGTIDSIQVVRGSGGTSGSGAVPCVRQRTERQGQSPYNGIVV